MLSGKFGDFYLFHRLSSRLSDKKHGQRQAIYISPAYDYFKKLIRQ
jgi:hypothetical protein